MLATSRRWRVMGVTFGAAAFAGLFGSSPASAQCTDNFSSIAAVSSGGLIFPLGPASVFSPLGSGSSLSALTSTINTINTAFLTQSSAFVSAPGNPQPDQQGGGAWARGIGGELDIKTKSTGTLDTSSQGFATTGAQTCHTSVHQDYGGFQVGQDFSVLNGRGTGSNWHWGVTAGYLEVFGKDNTPAGTFVNPNFPGLAFETPAGSLRENSQIPFVGIYTAFTKGSFFADAQARWDFIQNSLTDPNNGLAAQRLDARSFSVTANAGYNIALANNWFIEPSGGVVWSTTTIDPLNVPGVFTPFGFIAQGTVRVDDIESVLGRASLSIGKTISGQYVTWQPYFTASVFHEFSGDVTVTSAIAENAFVAPAIAGVILTSKSQGGVGTYGQFTLGTAAVFGSTGWLGYGRVDYRTGDNIEGWSVNAGMRYQFTPTRSGSVKDGPEPTVGTYNWTGPYIGAVAGSTTGIEEWVSNAFGTTVNPRFAGYVLGGEAGYNVQIGRAVLGVEGNYDFTNAKGGKSCPNQFFFTCEAEADRLAAFTARLGLAWGRALFYAKAGWAGGEVLAGSVLNNPAMEVGESSHWRNGWTAGGGMEFALTDRWSAKGEWMHYDLGSESFVIQSNVAPAAGTVDVRTTGDVVRVGVNYHFSPTAQFAPLR